MLARKWFHLIAVCVYIPGIILDPAVLHLASSFALSLFIILEVSVCVEHMLCYVYVVYCVCFKHMHMLCEQR